MVKSRTLSNRQTGLRFTLDDTKQRLVLLDTMRMKAGLILHLNQVGPETHNETGPKSSSKYCKSSRSTSNNARRIQKVSFENFPGSGLV